AWSDVKNITSLLLTIKEPELFLSPGPSPDWLISLTDVSEDTIQQLTFFRQIINKWHQAILLPVDQLILTIAGDIFFTPDELSLSHKIATFQKQLSTQHPDWELPSLLDELKSLARNERRFFAGGEGDQFKPEEHKGKVVITTAHKAKGLEWDRVYLMSANNYNFPSGSSEDTYISEKWFIRDGLNLPVESLSQLDSLFFEQDKPYKEGSASILARFEYIRERLRLFYVSITRAKQELIITWNSGRNGKSVPSKAFRALVDFVVNSDLTKKDNHG
ncbi:MAG: hypothetical protein MUP11_05910, partial [Anaerolineales bacterium]|nr:hypothetical protein [Anaerolineales bacterium]